MQQSEAVRLIHTAFYRVVRTAKPMTFKQFMESTIESTWPEDTSPSGWPDFWWESVALEIQNAVVARQEYLREFGRNWLKQNKAKKWKALLAHMAQHLGPLA